jgi:hypothetical protein
VSAARQIALSGLAGAAICLSLALTMGNFSWNMVCLASGLGAALQAGLESRSTESSPEGRVRRVLGATIVAAILSFAVVLAFAVVQIALDPVKTWG